MNYSWLNQTYGHFHDRSRTERLCRELRHEVAWSLCGYRSKVSFESNLVSILRHNRHYTHVIMIPIDGYSWRDIPNPQLLEAFEEVGYRPSMWTSLVSVNCGAILFSLSRDALMAQMLLPPEFAGALYRSRDWETNQWAATVLLDAEPDK